MADICSGGGLVFDMRRLLMEGGVGHPAFAVMIAVMIAVIIMVGSDGVTRWGVGTYNSPAE